MAYMIFRHFGGNFGPGITVAGLCDCIKQKMGHEGCPTCHKLWNDHANDEILACFKALPKGMEIGKDNLRIDYNIYPLTVESAIRFGIGRRMLTHAIRHLQWPDSDHALIAQDWKPRMKKSVVDLRGIQEARSVGVILLAATHQSATVAEEYNPLPVVTLDIQTRSSRKSSG
jgi:hypothetical protein